MNQHQRDSVAAGRALVDKVNLLSVNFRSVLVELIDPRFLRTPVVFLPPIVGQLTDFLDIRPVFPARAWQLFLIIPPSANLSCLAEMLRNIWLALCLRPLIERADSKSTCS
jgi:hypothetical protein